MSVLVIKIPGHNNYNVSCDSPPAVFSWLTPDQATEKVASYVRDGQFAFGNQEIIKSAQDTLVDQEYVPESSVRW